METGLIPPEEYVPFKPAGTETSQQFIWPKIIARRSLIIPQGNLKVRDPEDSLLSAPCFWYYKQSSYRDTFTPKEFQSNEPSKIVSDWKEPVGKYGKFIGKSVYEHDFMRPK